jgi:hypothetical protein
MLDWEVLIIWIQSTTYCQKNGIQSENTADTNFNILFVWGPPVLWGLIYPLVSGHCTCFRDKSVGSKTPKLLHVFTFVLPL